MAIDNGAGRDICKLDRANHLSAGPHSWGCPREKRELTLKDRSKADPVSRWSQNTRHRRVTGEKRIFI